jgi:hypothetical protein
MMWTLTYSGSSRPKWNERERVKADVNAFMRRWRSDLGKAFPYLYVIEEHKDGHLHVHLLVPYFFYEHSQLMTLWGHGGINFARRARGRSLRDRGRLANYVSKYLTKQFDELDENGLPLYGHAKYQHRYDTARDFTPVRESHRFETYEDAADFFESRGWVFVFDSRDVEVWSGPLIRAYNSSP